MATGMDYSLVQRIIDGLGKILDTKPGSPDEGTYVTEQQLADWIKGQTFVTGYYYNGAFYKEATHTTLITPQANVLYADLGAYGLYDWDGAAYQPFTPDLSPYATKAEMQTADANLQSQVDVLDHRLDNLEQAHGSYVVSTYKDGAITPSGKGNWAVVEGLRGVSRVENNLIQNGNFDGTTNWSSVNTSLTTFTVTNNVATVTMKANVPATGQYNYGIRQTFGKTIAGHKYLIRSRVKSEGTGLLYDFDNSSTGKSITLTPNVWTDFIVLTEGVASNSGVFYIIPDEGLLTGQSFQVTGVAICDLTLYFGGTIPSDADTIADIQRDYPHLLLPSDYGTRIIDWTGNGVRAWARNLWDEVWEVGTLNVANGENVVSSQYSRSVGYIPCLPSTIYYGKTSSNFLGVLFYDMNKTYIAGQSWTNGTNRQFTSIANAYYMRFVYEGQTYNHDICINVSDANDGTYTPYFAPNTLSFPSISLKSAGSVYDSCEPNVEVSGVQKRRDTQRIVSTALDNKTWMRRDDGLFYTSTPVFSDAKDSSSNVLCDKFLPCPSGHTGTSTAEGCISVGSGGYIYAKKASIADTTAFLAYVADSVLYSEAKTESVTLSDPIIDNTLLTEAYGRLSTVQTGTVVDGISDLGFITL